MDSTHLFIIFYSKDHSSVSYHPCCQSSKRSTGSTSIKSLFIFQPDSQCGKRCSIKQIITILRQRFLHNPQSTQQFSSIVAVRKPSLSAINRIAFFPHNCSQALQPVQYSVICFILLPVLKSQVLSPSLHPISCWHKKNQ